MRTVPAIPITLLLMMSGCHARRGEFSPQDEAAVRAVADSAVQYQLSGKWDAWAGLFSDDGILHPPNGPALKGRAALLAWARTLPPIQKAAFTDVQVWGDAESGVRHQRLHTDYERDAFRHREAVVGFPA